MTSEARSSNDTRHLVLLLHRPKHVCTKCSVLGLSHSCGVGADTVRSRGVDSFIHSWSNRVEVVWCDMGGRYERISTRTDIEVY